MRNVVLLIFFSVTFVFNARSQTVTIHGSSGSVVLYQITNTGFQQIITSEIWMYANGSVGVAIPYSLQQSVPPQINGTPVVDFRPMTCYECKVAYGTTSTVCGPFLTSYENGKFINSCSDTNTAACKLEYTDGNGTKVQIWNPQID